jgi:hypothetical protein
MKGSGKTGYKSNENEKENAGTERPFHADEHDQSDIDVPESKPIKENGKAENNNDKDEFESIETEISKHADEYN